MNKNKVRYAVSLSAIVLASILICMLVAGCSMAPEETAAETEETVVVSETPAETSNVEETTDESTENTVDQAGSDATTDTENTGTDKNGDILVFEGDSVNGNNALIFLEVNVKTGDIKGLIQMGFKSFDMDLKNTKICDYVLEGVITGSLDLKTSEITGELKGKAVTDTQLEGCRDYNVTYPMIAGMFEDKSRIKGYFDTNTQDEYEFYLKNISK